MSEPSGLRVEGWIDFWGGFLARHGSLWERLGKIESHFLTESLAEVELERPIYICGLARSGTTILLEWLSTHPELCSHQYRDFPFLFTPYWWNWMLARMATREELATERVHKDRIKVTSRSPEAMEEMLWMHFFPNVHDSTISNVLDGEVHAPDFEAFYKDHIRKLMLIRGGSRYLAKGNYNIARLGYLQKMNPDARFIVMIREPEAHIASLSKQHRILGEVEKRDPRILNHMRRVGHFEFGLDRRPINFGQGGQTQAIQAMWECGEEVRGWACYWNDVYAFLNKAIEADKELSHATLIVRYEDLCTESSTTLDRISQHCDLSWPEGSINPWLEQLSQPTYYQSGFGLDELDLIANETEPIRGLYGYQ